MVVLMVSVVYCLLLALQAPSSTAPLVVISETTEHSNAKRVEETFVDEEEQLCNEEHL